MVAHTVARRFIDVLHHICILMGSTSLIKVLLVVGVVATVVLGMRYVRPVVPSWYISVSRSVNSIIFFINKLLIRLSKVFCVTYPY